MPPGSTYNMVDPATGRAHAIAEEDVAGARAAGWTFEDDRAAAARTSADVVREQHSGVGQKLTAGWLGAVRGATLGLSDVAFDVAGNSEEVARLKAANPGISTATEIGGGLAAAALSGGSSLAASLPAGAVARAGTAITRAGAGGGLAAKVATGVAGGAVEGAAANLGMYASEVALGNKELSAEAAIGAGLDGAMWGAAAGGALAVSERAFTSSRKLFADADVTPEVVERVEREAAAEVDAAARDVDAMADAAKARVRAIRTARSQVDPEVAAAEARIREARVLKAEAQAQAATERAGAAAAGRQAAEVRLERTKAGPAKRGTAAAEAAGAAPTTPDVPESVPAASPPAPPIEDIARTPATPAPAPQISPPPADIPAGFRYTGEKFYRGKRLPLEPRTTVPTYDEVKGVTPEQNPVWVLKPSQLAEADVIGAELTPGNVDSIVKAWDDGIALPEIDAMITPSGRLAIEDGNHRLAAAAKSDRPVLLKIKAVSEKGPRSSDKSIRERTRAALPAPAAPAGDDLSRLLAESTERLKGGAKIGDLTAEARGVTAQADQSIDDALDEAIEAVDPDAAYFADLGRRLTAARDEVTAAINPREYAARLGGRADAKAAQARAAGKLSRDRDVIRETAGERRIARDPKTGAISQGPESYIVQRGRESTSRLRDPYTPAEIEARTLDRPAFLAPGEGKAAAEVLKGRNLAGAIARGVDPGDIQVSAMFDVGGGRLKSATRAATGADLVEAIGRSDPAALTDDVLARIRAGVDDDPADLERVIAAFRRFEDVEREAVKALGPDAPTGAIRRATAHAEAMTARQGAAQATAAQQAEVIAAQQAPAQVAALARPVTAHAERAAVGDLSRAFDAPTPATATQAAATIAPGAPGAPPAAATGRLAGVGGKVADVATALEVLGTLGVPGLPRPEDIPGIGPVLGLVLKARAAYKVYQRIGGKVPATAEGEVAKRAAATRNRIRGAVRGLLTGAAATTRAVQPTAPIAAVLGARLFEGGEPAPKRRRRRGDETQSTAEMLYAKRADELVRAQAPGAIAKAVNARLNVASPELRQAVIGATTRKLAFLASKLPGGGLLRPPLPTGEPEWSPDRASLETFARYVEAANDPAGVLERALGGDLSLEGVETLQAVYPQIFAEAQAHLFEHAEALSEALPYHRRMALSTLFEVPLDDSMQPEYIADTIAEYTKADEAQAQGQSAPGGPPAPGISANVTIGERSKMPLDRISQR